MLLVVICVLVFVGSCCVCIVGYVVYRVLFVVLVACDLVVVVCCLLEGSC